VEIYDVATIHAKHFLVTYVPSQKLVFIADHLNSPYETGIPTASLNTTTMYEALLALDLDIKKIAIAHGARVFTMKEMQASVDAYSPQVCMADRPVCK
jgi:glyoxylase-like metal-dependent hydrolase (beta-lactamase superfamily II)